MTWSNHKPNRSYTVLECSLHGCFPKGDVLPKGLVFQSHVPARSRVEICEHERVSCVVTRDLHADHVRDGIESTLQIQLTQVDGATTSALQVVEHDVLVEVLGSAMVV